MPLFNQKLIRVAIVVSLLCVSFVLAEKNNLNVGSLNTQEIEEHLQVYIYCCSTTQVQMSDIVPGMFNHQEVDRKQP